MGTGIVSVALASDHQLTLSRILLALAAAVWLALAGLVAWQFFTGRQRLATDARSPAALTAVAATAVLGARLAGLGWIAVAAVLLALAGLLWLALLAPVLRNWSAPVPGSGFMLTVAAQSLAVLAAQLAVRERAPWLLYLALPLAAAGLAWYGFVLGGFDWRQLLEGRGDQWVSGGALAISALAAARITIAAGPLHVLGGRGEALKVLTLALWGLALAWLPALTAAELLRPRLSHYDLRRWATVFPLGMYAASSFDAGIAAGVRGLVDFARVWVWVGFLAWLVVFAAMVWQAPKVLRGAKPSA